MTQMIQFMAAPLVACALLAGIHGYLGIHVVRRGVIFVDISLAQMAALGAAVGIIFNLEINSLSGNILSVLFTFAGALLLASVRPFERIVPIEAFIGVLYVAGAALVVLIMDRSAHGAEHVKDLMVGQILWVNWKDVTTEAIVYAVIGLVFYFINPRINAISEGAVKNGDSKSRVFLWDMIFYALFGVVVTVSVRVAGVLLVFTYLVAPAIIAAMFAKAFINRLIIGWAIGIGISLMGVLVSYRWDFPTGPAVVAAAGLFLVIASLWKWPEMKRLRATN